MRYLGEYFLQVEEHSEVAKRSLSIKETKKYEEMQERMLLWKEVKRVIIDGNKCNKKINWKNFESENPGRCPLIISWGLGEGEEMEILIADLPWDLIVKGKSEGKWKE